MKNDEPLSSLKQIYIIIKYEIDRAWQNKRILIAISISVILSLFLLIIIPTYTAYKEGFFLYQMNWKIYLFYQLFALNYLLFIFPIIFSFNALSREYEYESGLTMFIQPIYRETLFFGKLFSSIIIISFLNILNYLFLTVCYMIVYLSTEALLVIFSSFLIYSLASITYISVTFLINSIVNRGHITVIILVFVVFLLGISFLPKTDEYLLGPIFSIPYNSFSSIIILDPNETFFAMLLGMHPDIYPITWISITMLSSYIVISIIGTGFWENMKELK